MLELFYCPSNASMAPHMLLEEIGAPFRLTLVDRSKNAHKSASYLKLNPSGRIPSLIDGELVLFETAAICLYLADKYPEASLAPEPRTEARAVFYVWLMYLSNTLQPELSTYFYPERYADDADGAVLVKQHAEARVGMMVDLVDAQLAKSGPFLLGDRYSLLDPYLLMLLRWTRMMQRPAQQLPRCRDLLERVLARPAIQRAFKSEGLPAPWYEAA